MKCYLTYCVAGFFAFNENCNLLDYELFPKAKIAEKHLKIQDGNLTPEEELILKKITKKCDKIVIETKTGFLRYKNLKGNDKFEFKSPNIGGDYLRENLISILSETEFIISEEDFKDILHSISMEIVQSKLKDASKAEDVFLIQAINAIDELEEANGKLIERIREWYAIHFPEMDKLKNHEKYVKLVAEFGDRSSIIESSQLDPDMDMDSVNKSSGAALEDNDKIILQSYASSIKSLQESKKSLIKYVDTKMEEIAPNLKDLVGSSLGAKIIAHSGSTMKLAKLPASTVQIMGAEKALFRHKKTGERPPKHGLIYQHPDVRSSKWWIRGKVARALAAKIALAIRKDVFSGEYDPSIKEEYNEKLEEIKKANPFPKRSKKGQIDKNKKTKKKKKRNKISKKQVKDYYY
ncbi:MAG: ATP-binding protein [Methanobacterium sp. BRmetb2]|jgi:nucleolar protein 56|nr:MAG: ATP-binding protein [Methanobacterium sp. BRmetb2]